ncbi:MULTISPECIES: type I-D CRISPR-associated protein Cas10d/Csc3 [Trichocoleus]|uniref:Type I-D CRISPR-associated protein Cas10d/Csc3 n=1 Tax=Trichocoleus desertorum GB2-A4 TaxID=2933944 RepID=A0ABV0JC36_9CYAN|nr:type I-D CRISPR-associated protein Cas10d/Csc3 [Trichocoleus sp. FACHB-46]
MKTLLQTLLLETLPHSLDSVLFNYINVVLPAVEQEFGRASTFCRTKSYWKTLTQEQNQTRQLISSDKHLNQSLLINILNSLLIVWSLIPLLNEELALSKDEKCLLCVWFTLQGYNSCYSSRVTAPLLTPDINLGEVLNLDMFWPQWREYLPEIDYLTQITLQNSDNNTSAKRNGFRVPDQRLRLTLHPLLSFSTIAAQLTSPVDIVTTSAGDRLPALLKELGIDRTLIYHRLRNCTGLLTNSIHNAVLNFTEKLNWQPILCFTEGVVYLAPRGFNLLNRMDLQQFIWEQISDQLVTNMLVGEIGFKRDGKGLKAAPQILELLSPAQLIQGLPSIVEATIKNEIDPATPKRLMNLSITTLERKFLSQGADLRSDRIAEFIIFLQKQFFRSNSEFIAWILEQLGIQSAITWEQAQIHTGGVNLGWYHAAAYYVANSPHLDLRSVTRKLQEIASRLTIWAEEKKLFPVLTSATREAFDRYLVQYLELPGWDSPESSFEHELATYMAAKTKAARQPICSLSSGEFVSEAQMASVVPFKPQQYSNKNPLGGRQLKRGISKIWSLEMLLRQAFWSFSPGKLEERQPVFLYFSPTFAHAPPVTKVIHILAKQLERVNLWKIRRFWQEHGMDANALRFYPWLKNELNSNEESQHNLTFLAMTYTTTKGKNNDRCLD